jgi:hypothetical protein
MRLSNEQTKTSSVARYARYALSHRLVISGLLSHADLLAPSLALKPTPLGPILLLNSLTLPMNAPSRTVLLAVVIPRWCLFQALSSNPALGCLRLRSLLVTLLTLTMNLAAQAELIRGELLNEIKIIQACWRWMITMGYQRLHEPSKT